MPQRKDAAEHRCKILQTAKSLFSMYGVDQVSMHQIAKSAGIGQGTLYRNFSSKADLCLDLLGESHRLIREELSRRLGELKDASARSKLELVLFFILDFIEEKSQWLGAMQTPVCPEGRSSYYRSPIYETMHEKVKNLFEEAVRRQECPVQLDPVFAADALLAAMDPDLYMFLRRYRGYSVAGLKENLRTVYLDRLFTTKG